MIIDANTFFSVNQAITGDAWSTDHVDLKAEGDSVGMPPVIVIQCTEVFNTLTSLDISLKCHEDTGFSTGTKTLATFNVLLAGLTANTILGYIRIPPGCERYLKLYYDVQGSNPSTGKITSFVAQAAPVGMVSNT